MSGKTKSADSAHTNFVRKVELPAQGVIEFRAWEKCRFLGVAGIDYNGRITKPFLVLEDCPSKKQLTYRFLVLAGEAAIPQGERWVPMECVWQGKGKSFGTLWMSADVDRSKDPEAPEGPAAEKPPVRDEEIGQHVEAMAP